MVGLLGIVTAVRVLLPGVTVAPTRGLDGPGAGMGATGVLTDGRIL